MNPDFHADLHCHSTHSDGTKSPEELLSLAKEIGLQGLSITDHDTIAAYPEVLKVAKRYDIEVIPGVELSTMHNGTSIHILAYRFDPESSELSEFCLRHQKRRLERNSAILDKLKEHGMDLTQDLLVSASHTVGRPHIAMALFKAGFVTSYDEAFRKYLGDQKPCFIKGHSFHVRETLEIIHASGGIAVLAHPHLIKNNQVVKDLLKMPFEGIEGYYARFPLKECQKWIDLGKTNGWIITGGSDYHGDTKPDSRLGSSWVNKETFERIK